MGTGILEAIEALEKENANLQPELVTAERARELLSAHARAEKLVSFGIAALSRKLDDSAELARLTGSSVAKAKNVVATAKVMASSEDLSSALQHGDISLDQASRDRSGRRVGSRCRKRAGGRAPRAALSCAQGEGT